MKKVYLVDTTTEGPIGVFSSVNKAKECAETYIGRKANELELKCLKRMKTKGSLYVSLYGDPQTCKLSNEEAKYSAHIEAMELNLSYLRKLSNPEHSGEFPY